VSGIRVRYLESSDAAGLTALFERCYGRSYGTAVFYDPDALTRLIESGGLRSVVAVTGDGRLVGHTGIRIHDVAARICETGNTVVDPEARGQGLLKRLGGALRERVLAEGYLGYVHYPTTAHAIMQQASVRNGGSETGVMLAYVAATTEYRAVERRPGRLAATVAFQPLAALPGRRVHVPSSYAALVESIYADAGLEREVLAAAGLSASRPAASGPSALSALLHSERGVLSLALTRHGGDLREAVERQLTTHAPEVAHLDLLLDDPAIDAALAVLRPLGFIFCAVLPEFGRTDVLRLQRLREPRATDFEPELVNAGAERLCALMRREAGETGSVVSISPRA
jgi:GNAT superfamily N-acetyltransferase